MGMTASFILVALAISVAMMGAWLIQWRTRNASWVDAIWTITAGFGGTAYALLAGGNGAPFWRRAAIAVLAFAWATRLGLYIAGRAATGHEDARYTELRTRWGSGYEPRMFAFLQLQALIAWVLAFAVLLAARNPVRTPRLIDLAGVLLIVLSILGEALADQQLKDFRSDPAHRGQICDTGLWAWSRHPNYFFEWLVWVGFALFALDFSARFPWGWAALLAPVMMYLLLVHVSGVAMVERAMALSRGAQFARYQARVSKFFLLPPKRTP